MRPIRAPRFVNKPILPLPFICESGLANSPDAHPPPPPPNCSQSLHPLPFCPLPNLPLSRQRRKKKLFFYFPDERSPLKVAPSSSSSPAKKHLERKSGKGKEEEEEASLRKRKRSMGRCGIRHCFRAKTNEFPNPKLLPCMSLACRFPKKCVFIFSCGKFWTSAVGQQLIKIQPRVINALHSSSALPYYGQDASPSRISVVAEKRGRVCLGKRGLG